MAIPHPRRRDGSGDHRRLIHLLNQRYHEQWLRAERLERDLARVRGRLLGPALAWLLQLKRLVLGRGKSVVSALERSVPLEEHPASAAGRVSILIPFRDRAELLRDCLRSLRFSTYSDREIVLIDNGSVERRTLRLLERLRRRPGYRLVTRPAPFNFSWLCNEGARQASGDWLLFLNNDTEVITPDWIERMLRVAARPDVGIIGATLLYPDGTIQHAGLHPTADGRWVHAHRGRPACDSGPQGELAQVRIVPAVTAACLLIHRDRFRNLGGFDERLPVTYNDVDLCCRIRQRGLHVTITPHARLLHYEGITRGFSGDCPGAGHLERLDRFPDVGRPEPIPASAGQPVVPWIDRGS